MEANRPFERRDGIFAIVSFCMAFMVQSSHQSHGGREQLPPTLFGKSGSALNERKQKSRDSVLSRIAGMFDVLLRDFVVIRKDDLPC